MCNSSELVLKQFQVMSSEVPKIVALSTKPTHKLSAKSVDNCTRCSRSHEIGKCPVFNKKCNNCHNMRHFAVTCKFKRLNKFGNKQVDIVQQNDSNQEDESTSIFIGTVNGTFIDSDWCEVGLLNNKCHSTFMLDTGAQCNVITEHLAEKAGAEFSPSKIKTLLSFSNHKVLVYAECLLEVEIKHKKYNLLFMVVESEDIQPILGKDTCANGPSETGSRVVPFKQVGRRSQ